ncbi:gallinacin-10-like [Rhineura floridana]|uniref:gallinacin-10-like n=1 Tax=Rhineura floridana TaxID=261503 RepID=UPI002AC852D8|nr:gallinacin-10-like [Rhineura floridana]
MRILYFFVAVVFFLFQICPGYTQGPPPLADTIACRNTPAAFCQAGVCPPTFREEGTCFGGAIKCCKKAAF